MAPVKPPAIDSPTDARPDLPRLPAPRHRLQRLQRLPRAGAGRPRTRGPPALPGPRRPTSWTWVGLGRWRRPARGGDRPQPGHRRPAARLRRRLLRGLRGEDVRASSATTSSTRYIEANVAAVRDVVDAAGGIRRRARQPPRDGPGDPRPRRTRRRGWPGFAAKVHGSALEYTVKPEPERFLPFAREGMEAASRRPRRLPPHRREPLGRRSTCRTCPRRPASGPPGVDIDLFAPAERAEDARARAWRADPGPRARLAGAAPGEPGGATRATAADALEWFAEGDGPAGRSSSAS